MRWRFLDQLKPLCKELGKRATLQLFDDADHSFHVPAKSGRTDAEVMSAMLDAFAEWVDRGHNTLEIVCWRRRKLSALPLTYI